MTVYVDDMHADPLGAYRGMKMSHMIADTDDELHAMAAHIGVRRHWHQKAGTAHSHYDIALSKREAAVRRGAVEITMRQCASMVSLRRFGQPMGDPATAIERFRALRAQRLAAGEVPDGRR